MRIVVFEDDLVDNLKPVSLTRPAYSITCGAMRLADWLEQLDPRMDHPIHGIVRPHLRTIQQIERPQWDWESGISNGATLLVNARAVPSRALFQQLQAMVAAGQPAALYWRDHLVAALVDGAPSDSDEDGLLGLSLETSSQDTCRQGTCLDGLPVVDRELPLLEYPHDIIRYHLDILGENLEHRLGTGRYREIRDGVFAAADVTLGEYCVTDTRSGPILLDEGAAIGPFCLITGPAHIGRGAKLIAHATSKGYVSLGHATKIGGEVDASIIEPFTNKQHHGFLGHSYLGSWINVGAGTCNSDLKNTYGQIHMEYADKKVATGMQFFGCIVGDYSKTAINTSIFTGKTIGVCSMLYGLVTTNVPSFANYARQFGQVTGVPPHVMIETQKRMFLRRNVPQRPCDMQLIQDLHALTRDERHLSDEPLTL